MDIEWIDGVAVGSSSARDETLKIAKALHHVPSQLAIRQLICGGYGYVRDNEISSLSIPAADSYYGGAIMLQHCNHIHVGY